MNDPIPGSLLDLVSQRAEDWKNLFYWAIGGMAVGLAGMAVYVKGLVADVTASKVESAKGDQAQAESYKLVASALEKLAEAVRRERT